MNKIICDCCDKDAKYFFEWKFQRINAPMEPVGLGNIGSYDVCEEHKIILLQALEEELKK